MLATVKLKELIEGKGFGEISEVYANNLPKELEENTDKTIVLLTESNPSLDLSGNNTFFRKIERVEIQIFYKLDIDFDIEAFEMELIKFLKNVVKRQQKLLLPPKILTLRKSNTKFLISFIM